MDKKNQNDKTLNWDEFRSLGNPDNVEDSPLKDQESNQLYEEAGKQRIRIFLDRKKRKGKGVTIIEGLEASEEYFEDLTREFKKKCGVGGSTKDGLVLIQGDHRNKLKDMMLSKGFRDTKISGA